MSLGSEAGKVVSTCVCVLLQDCWSLFSITHCIHVQSANMMHDVAKHLLIACSMQ